MINKQLYNIFNKGSTTYFYSSLFFPKNIREEVFILYSFVRLADDFVDTIPQKRIDFIKFKKSFEKAAIGKKTDNEIINNFIKLFYKKQFKKKWIDAFFTSMEMDLSNKTYKNLQDIEKYIFGSAEIVGLMMAKIMNLPKQSYTAARKLAKAMQFINFIRDIDEDIQLQRTYIPLSHLNEFGLKNLTYNEIINKLDMFKKLITKEIKIYYKWQNEAEKGYKYIPKKYLIPIKTAADMYKYTADILLKNPLIVYKKKVKPSKIKIIYTAIKNYILV